MDLKHIKRLLYWADHFVDANQVKSVAVQRQIRDNFVSICIEKDISPFEIDAVEFDTVYMRNGDEIEV